MSIGSHSMRAGDLVRVRGERWRLARRIPYDAAAVIEVEGCDTANRGEHARFLLPFEPLDRIEVSSVPRVVRAGQWRHVARRALADARPPAPSLRAATRATLTLIPFQLEPALALARGDGCRFLIADAVGMGKTVQAGLMAAELLERRPESRMLVVAPAGLRDQWRDELHTRFRLEASVFDAAAVARIATQFPAGINPWSVHPMVITSIDYLKRAEVIRCLETLIWDLVIFDEAHGLAGRSDRAAAAHALGHRARALVMLTATPHSGDDEAFRRMCGIGALNDGHPLRLFRRTRADVGTEARRTSLLRVQPTAAEALMHGALMEYARTVWAQSEGAAAPGARLAMSVLMRRASSSAASLARSIERRMALLTERSRGEVMQPGLPFAGEATDDDEPHAALGAAGMADSAGEHLRLTRLLRLAHDAAFTESKLRALRRLLSRTQEPVIVFTEYRDTLDHVASALAGIDAVQLHGGLRQHERADVVRRFTTGAARLLLATDAASEGLNLHQRCRVVVNLELPWTPLRLEQRAGRVDRIGQARTVHALHLVAAGTSEETVLAALDRRLRRMEQAIEALGQLPDEQQIAACVIAGQPLPDLAAAAPPPSYPGIATLDLGREAHAEAARIAAARTLVTPGDESGAEIRPVITRLRRHHTSPHLRIERFWLFQLIFTGADGRVLWESALALRGPAAWTPGRSSSLTRLQLDPGQPAVRDLAAVMAKRQLDAVRLMLRQPSHLWVARERALIEALRARHARLSAGLMQRALFDRRDERMAAAQSALLEEALSASDARLTELAAAEHPRVDSCQLVFGVAIECDVALVGADLQVGP